MENIDIKKEKEFLYGILLEIIVEKPITDPTITVTAAGSGNPVVLSYDYDKGEFGFPPNRFVKHNEKLLLCLGVGDDAGAYGKSLWFVANGYNGAIVFESKRASYFKEKGFELIDEN